MRIVLGIPVVNQKSLTQDCIHALVNSTIKLPNELTVVIIDNGSRNEKYSLKDFPKTQFNLEIMRNKENRGFYYPLKQLYDKYQDAEFIGLMHNDVFMYEEGWEERIISEFRKDDALALIGLCGSNEVDSNGGRGGGTMCNFNGTKGQPQSAGLKITDLQPTLILDSLFMMFRRTAIPALDIQEDIAPCHFYDRLWSLRIVENNMRVGTLGIEIDHMGGMTSVTDAQYLLEDAQAWCRKWNIPMNTHPDGFEDGGHAIYIEAERRFLSEYRDQKNRIPARISSDWVVRYG